MLVGPDGLETPKSPESGTGGSETLGIIVEEFESSETTWYPNFGSGLCIDR